MSSGSDSVAPHAWKWAMYNLGEGETESGDLHTIGEVTNESFWKPKWVRHKNPPKFVIDYSGDGVVVAGYKTRRDFNQDAASVIQALVPGVTAQEVRRIRGDIMVIRRMVPGSTRETATCDEESKESEEETPGAPDEATEMDIPVSLRETSGVPNAFLVRCEGASDDNVNMVVLLDREGIECGPDGEDTPGPLTFAHVRNRARRSLWEITGSPEVSRDIERGILEETIREAYKYNLPRVWKNSVVKEIYRALFAKVWRNLLPEDHPQSVKNPKLLTHVMSGLIQPGDLAKMSPQKLWPEHWRDLEEARIMRQIATLERSATASTDMFTCGRCGKNECTYREVQTRSADEPMTAFVLCLVCGNRWKE